MAALRYAQLPCPQRCCSTLLCAVQIAYPIANQKWSVQLLQQLQCFQEV